MKNFVKKLSVISFLMVFGILTGFSLQATDDLPKDNNGVNVTIDKVKGEIVFWTYCDGWESYEAISGILQNKDDVLHLDFFMVKIPRDNCFVPSKNEGSYTMNIWGGTLRFNPSGIVKFKAIYNPNKKE